MARRQPALFISHGGGPWPFIEEMRPVFAKTEAALRALPAQLPARPDAVLVVSGHWEEETISIANASHPPMVYDYSGFPEHTYHITYPAPGSPKFAARARELLSGAGFATKEDPLHGYDHGVFVPLFLMYPDADVPVFMISMKSGYDPRTHIAMGEALNPLRDENVLIIGSGLSYHNMRGFRTPAAGPVAEQFETWLNETISEPDPAKRNARLENWERAPAARLAHPREDHLVPLMVVAGASNSGPGERLFLDHAMGVVMASYRFD
ncbi:MAG: class III extradiol ring-cleavage dioxygenase [Bdellovibrionota bacterium]